VARSAGVVQTQYDGVARSAGVVQTEEGVIQFLPLFAQSSAPISAKLLPMLSQPREVRWERMFPDELEAAFAQTPLLFLPYGLCEPHGPACALGLDAIKAHQIACLAAREGGGIVAPPDYWHIHEIGGYAGWSAKNIGEVARAWLSSLPPWQHFKNVCYHLRALDALGFHAAILLTGHYGPNYRDLKFLLELVQPHVGAQLFGLPDFEANNPGFDESGTLRGDHAGQVETSLLWALAPDCVDVARFPAPDDGGAPHFALGPSARNANRTTGERMARDEARFLAAKGRDLLAQFADTPPRPRLATFWQVERLWEEVIAPRLRDFETMSQWPDQIPLSPESKWFPNSHLSDPTRQD